jgi:hypothetical protein
MVPLWLVQVLHTPQKFERPPFWNDWRYGIKNYGVEVTFNCMTQLVQKLLGGDTQTNRHTDRQTGDLISLTFLFKESRIKSRIWIISEKPCDKWHTKHDSKLLAVHFLFFPFRPLVWDRFQWRDFVNLVVIRRVPEKKSFLISWITTNTSKGVLGSSTN